MKIPKVLGIMTALSLVGVLAAGCGSKATTPTTTTTDVTVGTGNVTLSITSTGTMDYANYQNLSFAADGTVGTVSVKVGNLVTKGQVLATLDPTAWNTSLQTLSQAVQTAQRNLITAQSNLAADQRAVTAAQLNLTQGQISLQSDQNKLAGDQNSLANISAVQTAQNAVDAAQANLTAAQASLAVASAQGDSAGVNYLATVYIPSLQTQLNQAQANLKAVMAGTATTLTTTAALQVANAQIQLETDNNKIAQDQNSLLSLQAAIDNANTTVSNAQIDLTNAQTAVTTAQANLTTMQAASTQIVAPFDGAITAVNIAAGTGMSGSTTGAVKGGATAIVIADTSKFIANLMVNETDIPNISVGTLATVTASALSGVTLNARVATISPVATTQSGVVNYAVTATILGVAAPTRPASTTGTGTTTTTPAAGTGADTTPATTRTRTFPSTSVPGQSGSQTTGLPFAGGTPGDFANLTPDQQAALQQRIQQGGFGGTGGFGGAGGTGAAATSTSTQLRQGLSLTVNLIEQQKVGVLTVPNTAIKTISGKKYVMVKSSTGTGVQTEVTTGLSDYSNTEIVSGLTAGQVVLITKTISTAKAATTQAPNQQFIGGGGAILR